MQLKLAQFTKETLGTTSEAWIASADSFGIPTLEYERNIAWTENRINYSEATDSLAYGIFEDGGNEALAIVEIVYSKRPGRDVGWLKVLDISLSPSFSPSEVDADAAKLALVIDIFSVAISGTVDLTSHHKARVFKIYGRDEQLFNLLFALNERLRSKLSASFQCKMEGRWLVISIH